jgi:hypothetical protein
VSPVRYELSFHILENGILHTHRRENLEYYVITIKIVEFNSILLYFTCKLNSSEASYKVNMSANINKDTKVQKKAINDMN